MAKKQGRRKYSRKASENVERVMRKRKRGTLRSGGSGRRVTSRKQAIAIGLSEAREAGAKVPARGSRKSGGRKGGGARKSSSGARKGSGGTRKRGGGRKGSGSSGRSRKGGRKRG